MKDVFEPALNMNKTNFFEPTLNFDSEYSNFGRVGEFLKGLTPEKIDNFGKVITTGYTTYQQIKDVTGGGRGGNTGNQQQQIQYANEQARLNAEQRIKEQNMYRLLAMAKESEKNKEEELKTKNKKKLIIGLSIGGSVLIVATVLFFVFKKKK